MKVKVKTAFCLGGGRDAHEGDIIDLPEKEAKIKLANGTVEQLVEEAEPETESSGKKSKGK